HGDPFGLAVVLNLVHHAVAAGDSDRRALGGGTEGDLADVLLRDAGLLEVRDSLVGRHVAESSTVVALLQPDDIAIPVPTDVHDVVWVDLVPLILDFLDQRRTLGLGGGVGVTTVLA